MAFTKPPSLANCKTILMAKGFVLLILLVIVASCNGQFLTDHSKDNAFEQKAIETGTPKIPKPRGIYTDASIGYGIQDKNGNIWFGSNGEGVYFYDGKLFANFTEADGLDNNIVYSILEDNAGNIWVGTKSGLNRSNPKNNQAGEKLFTKVQIVVANNGAEISADNNPPYYNGVWSMMQDKNGTIWFGTDAGVFCFNGKHFTRFIDNDKVVNQDSLELKAIFSILEDKTGNIWFSACIDGGVSRFDGKTLTNIVPHDTIRRTDRIMEDKNGNLWFCAVFRGLGRYDGKTFTKNVFNEKVGFGPRNVLEDNLGNIWFDTQAGVGLYDGKNFKILTEKDGLPDKNLSPVLKDKSGNLWFVKSGMGLYQYNGTTFTGFSE
jgi:streptogramin lyase